MSETPLEIVIVGHVDHGKSTLIGRIIHDTGSMPAGKIAAIEAMCVRRGVVFEWAFLMDALRAERDQNITIDTSHIWFRTSLRPYVLVDAPGHREFLKNMMTGAARASAAVLVVAADKGVQDQTRRHAYLLKLLGVRQVAVVVNKMDLVGWAQHRFLELESAVRSLLGELELEPTAVIPVGARHGHNIVDRQAGSEDGAWYSGLTLTEVLDAFEAPGRREGLPLRVAVQDVYRFDPRRVVVGRVESGRLAVGDTLVFCPSPIQTTMHSLESWPGPAPEFVDAGGSVAFQITDDLDVKRGLVGTRVGDAPPEVTTQIRAHVFWMGDNPLRKHSVYRLKLATQSCAARVVAIDSVLDTASLVVRHDTEVLRDEVGVVVLEFDRPLALDLHTDLPNTGRFVLVEDYDVVGGGIVIATGPGHPR